MEVVSYSTLENFIAADSPANLRRFVFVLFGIGHQLPMKVVEEEDRLREKNHALTNGHKKDY